MILVTLLLVFTCWAVRKSNRLFSAAVIVLAVLAHNSFIVDFIGATYYLASAVLCAVVCIMLSIAPSITAVRLQFACILAILLNAVGYMMWFAYLDPAMYNFGFYLIYFYITIIIITGETDVGGYRNSRLFALVRRSYTQINIGLSGYGRASK